MNIWKNSRKHIYKIPTVSRVESARVCRWYRNYNYKFTYDI